MELNEEHSTMLLRFFFRQRSKTNQIVCRTIFVPFCLTLGGFTKAVQPLFSFFVRFPYHWTYNVYVWELSGNFSPFCSASPEIIGVEVCNRQTDRQTDKHILRHCIQGYVDFFFQLNLQLEVCVPGLFFETRQDETGASH